MYIYRYIYLSVYIFIYIYIYSHCGVPRRIFGICRGAGFNSRINTIVLGGPGDVEGYYMLLHTSLWIYGAALQLARSEMKLSSLCLLRHRSSAVWNIQGHDCGSRRSPETAVFIQCLDPVPGQIPEIRRGEPRLKFVMVRPTRIHVCIYIYTCM